MRSSLLAFFFAALSCAQEATPPPLPTAPSATAVSAKPTSTPAPIKTAAAFLPEGVVVEPATSMLYLMSEERQVRALDLKTGVLRWSSSVAERPLWVQGNTLLAQTGKNRLVLLKTSDGAADPTCALDPSITLPPIQQGPGSSSTLSLLAREGKLYLSWRYVAYQVRGVTDAAAPRSPVVDESGVVVVVPGACKAYRAGSVPEEEEAPAPPLAQILKKRLVLKSGTQAEKTLSIEGVLDPLIVAQSPQYVLLSEAASQDGARCALFSLSEERVVGHLEGSHPTLAGEYLVLMRVGGQVRVAPLHELGAYWEAPVRDISYRGPP